jgi:hypothetical protein
MSFVTLCLNLRWFKGLYNFGRRGGCQKSTMHSTSCLIRDELIDSLFDLGLTCIEYRWALVVRLMLSKVLLTLEEPVKVPQYFSFLHVNLGSDHGGWTTNRILFDILKGAQTHFSWTWTSSSSSLWSERLLTWLWIVSHVRRRCEKSIGYDISVHVHSATQKIDTKAVLSYQFTIS